MVVAVRESNSELHLQAERNMIPLTFAFSHINYSRYGTYYDVLFRAWQDENCVAFQNLKELGFGASITVDRFASIHDDLHTELFNSQAKGTAGPYRSGFSANINAVNTWIATSDIHSTLRIALKQYLFLKTSSAHKENTLSGKKLHQKNVDSLKRALRSYGTNPFSDSHAKTIQLVNKWTRKLPIIKAPIIGEEKMLSFIDGRLVTGRLDFFRPIKKTKVRTCLENVKRAPATITVIKEERQAFLFF